MRLTKEAIEEFQALCEQECGEAISFAEAEVRANEIVNLYLILAEPLPGEKEEPMLPASAKASADRQDDPKKEVR